MLRFLVSSDLRLSRRDWLRLSSAGVIGHSMSGWLGNLAAAAANDPQRRRACILLWMNGGPSQMDTFDLKPAHGNGGPYKEIQTAAPGLKISEHLPKIARFGDHLAVIRSMSTKEGDHDRATQFLRTGYLQPGPIKFPSIGALVSKELGDVDAALPNFVSIAGNQNFPAAYGSGFLGPNYAPLAVGGGGGGPNGYEQALRVQDLQAPKEVRKKDVDSRIELLQGLQSDFQSKHPGAVAQDHRAAYARAVRLMRTAAAKAFSLNEEAPALRDAYGRNLFGQGCLLARRLVERGVPFVEVTLENWDTHAQNFEAVKNLSATLDAAWSTLMEDLKRRGLLDTTLIVWMGEFGRTPQINGAKGRDHFPNAWSTVLAGGGIKGGQAYGKTSPDGTKVVENEVTVPTFLATVCAALGIDHTKQNMSNVNRPIRIVSPGAKPIREVLS
jgi:uncharacterized protein (DUF1501 family)